MTDRIDLDELDAGETDSEDGNRGDWFWRGTGDPEAEPDAALDRPSGDASTAANADEDPDVDGDSDPVPHVPHRNRDRPVGIPVESGGAGTGAGSRAGGPASEEPAGTESAGTEPAGASRPHGGGVDDMTVAFTYGAMTRLADPQYVVADASGWADWLGIVGRVDAHVINKFQRDHGVDVDFFNGSGTGPGERLADVDEHSMFYADRMVVVGVEGEDERVAETAGWEFVPLSEAARKAGWEVTDP